MKMAKVEVVVKESEERSSKNPLLEAARKMRVLGLGAASLAQEQMEDLMCTLVERGEAAEQEGRDMVREAVDWQREQVRQAVDWQRDQLRQLTGRRKDRPVAGKADESGVESQLEALLESKDVPAKSDIEALEAQVAALTAKLDELKKEKAGE
jgi:poly(hydroxyalkanoate) granule-associated protein